MSSTLTWGNGALELTFSWTENSAPYLSAAQAGAVRLATADGIPLVEVLTATSGRTAASARLVRTVLGESFRYVSHEVSQGSGWSRLQISLRAGGVGGDAREGESLDASVTFALPDGVAAFRVETEVTNRSLAPVVLRAITSWSSSFGGSPEPAFASWALSSAKSDWLAESRWATLPLRGHLLPDLAAGNTGINPRGAHQVVSRGTWSTGADLPVAALSSGELGSGEHGATWMWQIEHNGPWRWEVGEDLADGYFALAGPTEVDHGWTKILRTGEGFSTVPVAVALASDLESAAAELTRFRRAARRKHPDNQSLGVIFNDYMNTIMGDPTTEKLLPLIETAAAVGAEVFCIDAGWYDDSGHWWPSVGAWTPSVTRFPGGLAEVTSRILELGMVPGLWLEPEVIGVRSPIAALLPDSAFLQRNGERLVEQERYHLDFRSIDARNHLDEVVDRLIHDFGVGYFKLDYNVNPGAGTDLDSDSLGDGLLGHSRAYLGWLDAVLDRHPNLIIENCGSGGMRADFAILSRVQLQSTSDQMDYLRYPPIAASAPMHMLPEQAGNWAYPQESMSLEEVAFSLATSLLGRLFISGYLNRMSDAQRELVAEAITVYGALRAKLASATPFWPLGLPEWDAEWVALGLSSDDARYVTVWKRAESREIALDLPALRGAELEVETIFPAGLEPWAHRWDRDNGVLTLIAPGASVGARVLRLRAG